jgi:hypothetical protein
MQVHVSGGLTPAFSPLGREAPEQIVADHHTSDVRELHLHLQEVEAWQARDVALQKEFQDTVSLSSPFQPILLKIFKRKIKRNKKASPACVSPFRSTPTDAHDLCVWLVALRGAEGRERHRGGGGGG